MYETHFGFHRQPFQASDVGSAYFLSDSIQKLLPQLLHALRTDLGIAVLTGPAGSGKTALLRHLRQLLSRDGRAIVCSAAGLESPAELLEALDNTARMQAGGSSVGDTTSNPQFAHAADSRISRWTVTERLRRSAEFWGPALLLIDDAQLLSVPVLNELRAFTEDLSSGTQLVRCLIAGPLSLEEELARPTHSDFSRRIRCHVFLQPFTMQESMAYLNQQLQLVGAHAGSVLTAAATDLIVSASDGSPRCINLLADESLVLACERQQSVVDGPCVRAALDRLQHLPYAWNIAVSHSQMPVDEPDSEETTAGINKSGSALLSADRGINAVRESDATAADSPVRATSRATFEFNAPGVIEIGSAAPVNHRPTSADPNPATATQPDSDSPRDELAAVEVTHAFELPELDDVVCDDGFVCDDGDGTDGNFREPDVCDTELTAPYLTETELACCDDDLLAEAGQAPIVVAERPTHVQLPPSDNDSVHDHTPIFDRYTWIALGRDVPDGLASTVAEWAFGAVDTSSEFATPSVAPRPANPIPVIMSSDLEIRMLLSEAISAASEGFLVLKPQLPTPQLPTPQLPTIDDRNSQSPWRMDSDADVRVGLAATIAESLAEDFPAAFETLSAGIRPDFDDNILEQIPAEIAQEHWRDGQLLESDNGTIGIPGTDSAVISEADETVSIRMRPESGAADDSTTPQSAAADDEADPEGLSFYTLPIAVDRVDADKRFQFRESDDEFPLAASMARLQSEVDEFHRNSSPAAEPADNADHRETRADWSHPAETFSALTTGDLAGSTNDDGTWRSGSLLQQALERLSASSGNSNPWSSQAYDNSAQQTSHRSSRFDLADAETFETASASPPRTISDELAVPESEQADSPRFSQLFTRLRGVQNRSDR